MKQILSLTYKELRDYFFQPLAYVFTTVYIVLTYWMFFSEFFLRGQADVQSFFNASLFLFPIFLPALTMTRWADEKKEGTLEILLTLPIRDFQVVIAKFLAPLILLILSLLPTLLLPLGVSILGDLDWGPVWGGYLGLILLGSLSLSIGLFVSSLTTSSIIAFIITFLLLALIHLAGSPVVTNYLPDSLGKIFMSVGSGSHFTSLARGVIDIRDVFYYVSTTLLFLYWNLLSLGSRKWDS
jgi:ABC-2 type transport system permease protein